MRSLQRSDYFQTPSHWDGHRYSRRNILPAHHSGGTFRHSSGNQRLGANHDFFTIETEEGAIEGYYSGAFYFQEGTYPDANMQQRGQILSVTAAYADLYLAEVFFDLIVDFEEVNGSMVPLGDSGTLIIAPR